MTGLNSKGYTPKALDTMAGLVTPGFRGNGAGYLNEIIDTLRFESGEKPIEVKEFIAGKWRFVAEV